MEVGLNVDFNELPGEEGEGLHYFAPFLCILAVAAQSGIEGGAGIGWSRGWMPAEEVLACVWGIHFEERLFYKLVVLMLTESDLSSDVESLANKCAL